MAEITYPRKLDNKEVAKQIKKWFTEKGFETKVIEESSSCAIKARKSSELRAMIGADRAMEVTIFASGEQTQVDTRQGSWKTNTVSNASWLVAAATGGINLAISGWSVIVQKELEGHIRAVLNSLGSGKEVS
jgi:hypothetical protein